MALKTRRTEHSGYVTGSDGQKEYDENLKLLKWDSKRKRRQVAKAMILAELEDLYNPPLCPLCGRYPCKYENQDD